MNKIIKVKVPDIGNYHNLPIIEIYVKVGDLVKIEQSLLSLESDKAAIDIPSPQTGIIKQIFVKIGDKVSKDTILFEIEEMINNHIKKTFQKSEEISKNSLNYSSSSMSTSSQELNLYNKSIDNKKIISKNNIDNSSFRRDESKNISDVSYLDNNDNSSCLVLKDKTNYAKSSINQKDTAYASPSVRKFARELGIDITVLSGTGPKGRITHNDIYTYMSTILKRKNFVYTQNDFSNENDSHHNLKILSLPKINFDKFGPNEIHTISRIRKISGENLHRNWVTIPHVTNHDEADITEIEKFRLLLNKEYQKSEIKLTILAFLIKASFIALKKFPIFNTSLNNDNLIFKKYFHIGFAVDTSQGIFVPVVHEVDKKGLIDISQEIIELTKLARFNKLKLNHIQGGCFSISSLGGIGGTSFTPIINAPEVAILGVCRSIRKPIWNTKKKKFIPRLILPLSLSYDHRVIDGAEATRFNAYLCQILSDFRRVLL